MEAKKKVSRFTDAQVTRIRPADKRFIVWGAHGLGLRVTPTGSKSWVYTFRFNGRSRMVTLGFCPPMMPAEARLAHLAAIGQRRSGIDPGAALAASRRAQRAAPTIDDLAAKFIELEAKPNTRETTWTEYARVLDVEIRPRWGRRLVHEVTRADVLALVDEIAIARGKPVAAARTLACLRRAFNWAISREWIQVSPCRSVRAPREEERHRALTLPELEAFLRGLLDDAPRRQDHAARLALLTVLATAQRPGEVAGLPWSELDLPARLWSLPRARTKNKHPHAVPLSPLALSLIEEARGGLLPSDWVFTTRGALGSKSKPGPLPRRRLRAWLTLNAKRWGFDRPGDGPFSHFHAHDLRRTAATMMESGGVPRPVIERVLNHVAPKLVRTYQTHGFDPEAREALDAWGARLEAMIAAARRPMEAK